MKWLVTLFSAVPIIPEIVLFFNWCQVLDGRNSGYMVYWQKNVRTAPGIFKRSSFRAVRIGWIEESEDVKTAYIMIGIQGSGKSEFCRKYLANVTRVNLDTLKTRNNEKRLLEECHEKGCDYVVDNTNPTLEDRTRYILPAKAAGYRVVGYFMQSRLQECIQRNNLRIGKEVVPPKAIAMTSNRLKLPNRIEGFDELYFVSNDGVKMTVSEWRDSDEF